MPANTVTPASAAASSAATKPSPKPPEVRRLAGAASTLRTTAVSNIAIDKAAAAAPSVSGGQGGSGPTGGSTGSGGAAKPPFDWDDIGLGSLVLAQADDEDAYYAAKVVATKANSHFVLTWADYPGYPEFSRPRLGLGLLHPGTLTKGR